MPELLRPHFAVPAAYRGDLGSYRSVLAFPDGRPVPTPAQWRRRRKQILDQWRRDLGVWPPPIRRPTVTALASERVDGLTRRRVRLEIAPGRTTEGYLLVPDGAGPFPAVLDVFYTPEGGAGLDPKARDRHDFGYQLARRGFVALCIGQQPWLEGSDVYYPDYRHAQLQPLGYLAYVASTCRTALARMPEVDAKRIGIVGHSYGGKWAMFAACLDEGFACAAVSDPGIVFDEGRSNVNYWEPWYLGWEAGVTRKAGIPTAENPRTGLYRRLVAEGRNLHELHALMAPRPFLVSGGSEDGLDRWRALNHLVAVNALLGVHDRVGLTTRPDHPPTHESNEVLYAFFVWWLKR